MKAAYLKGGETILVNGERRVVRCFEYTNKDNGYIRLRGHKPLYKHWDDEIEVIE